MWPGPQDEWAAQVSWVLGLASGFPVPHCDQEWLFHLPFRLKRASAFRFR